MIHTASFTTYEVELKNMHPNKEGILDKEQWERIKPGSEYSASARAGQWAVDIVRPSFFRRRRGRSNELGKTAYLDGLRGFAAFIVYWHHHQLWAHEGRQFILENAFGYNNQYYFACFHGIRTFFTGGHFAVAIFFVISGYVLSTKPLALIHAGEWTKLNDNLASALFRRWLRLYTPILCTTFLYLSFRHAFGLWIANMKWQSTYRDEVWMWYAELKNFSYVFNTGSEPWFSYNAHVWTIPLEYKGSLVVFTSLLSLSRTTRTARLWCEVGLIFYFLYIADGWPCALFASGMLLCDLDLLAERNELPFVFRILESYKLLIFYNLFFLGIFLGGVPSFSNDMKEFKMSPGWYLLSHLKPQAVFLYKAFYLFWAATFTVSSIPRISWLKSFFESSFNQYLGRISYALYLIHGPILWILGDRVYVSLGWVQEAHKLAIPQWVNWFPLPIFGPCGLEFAFLVPHLVLLPFTLWFAEVVTKVIDEPTVHFARWAYRITLAPPVK